MAQRWPYFTLLGQSIGSLIVAWDAFNLLPPDVFIDTMGYAFTLAFSAFLFPNTPTGAYVHYPTISTDMLSSLDQESGRGVNAGLGKGWRGTVKRYYWFLFAKLYSWVGGQVDVVMTNSSWTQNHIMSLWGPTRAKRSWTKGTAVVFPPVAVEELEDEIKVSEATEKTRQKHLLYIAQFRPEKDHHNIIVAFAKFLKAHPEFPKDESPKLVLIGSVRDEKDKMLVYKLRVLAQEHHISEQVEFVINAKWSQILEALRTSWVGVNGMWNEHFGIGVVEYQAAGLISVVDDSGGPKADIVVPIDGQPTGNIKTTTTCTPKADSQSQVSTQGPRTISPTPFIVHYRSHRPKLWLCDRGLVEVQRGFPNKSFATVGTRRWTSSSAYRPPSRLSVRNSTVCRIETALCSQSKTEDSYVSYITFRRETLFTVM